METDLHAVIRANILEPVHKQFIVYQTLKALLYCLSGDLVHRDLKPSNLLLNEECLLKVARARVRLRLRLRLRVRGHNPGPKPHPKPSLLKVADFGLARSLVALKKSDEGASVLTDYVATRWSRARAP